MAGTLSDEAIERWHQSKLHCRAIWLLPNPYAYRKYDHLGQMLLQCTWPVCVINSSVLPIKKTQKCLHHTHILLNTI